MESFGYRSRRRWGPWVSGLPQATERLQGEQGGGDRAHSEQKSRDASVDRNAIRVPVGYHEGPGSAARSQADPGTIRLSLGGLKKKKKTGPDKKERANRTRRILARGLAG